MSSVKDYARFWHYLSKNKRSATPTNFAFVATDTWSVQDGSKAGHRIHTLNNWYTIGVRYERNKWTRRAESTGDSAYCFWDWVYGRLDVRRPLWIWGFSVSQSMQLLSMGTEIERGSLEWETRDFNLSQNLGGGSKLIWQGTIILEDPPTVIELRHIKSGAKLWIMDTLNFWRCTSDEFFAGDKPVIAVEKKVRELVETIRTKDLGNMRWTASAQGLQCFRHRFMRHKILVHCDEDSLKLERDSYFGGNVSLYRVGIVKGPIYVVDYQSYYPSIMAERFLPVKWIGSTSDIVRCSNLQWCSDCWRIAKVTLSNSRSAYPIRHRGFLLLATGSFTTSLQEPELANAISEGCVARIHSVAWYARGVIFDKFVSELWSYRSEAATAGHTVEANLYKLFLNGVPGKLGQKQIQWVDCPEKHATRAWGTESEIDAQTGEITHYRYINWRVQRKRMRGKSVTDPTGLGHDAAENSAIATPVGPSIFDESKHSIPQIAGAITSWGRAILQETINVAGHENVYYTDTDCLHVSRDGFLRLEQARKIQPGTLGKLSIKTIASEAEYRGIKYYRLDDTWTISGKKNISTEIIDGKWQQSQFSGWSNLLYDGTCGAIHEYTVPCSRNSEFIPGTVLSDGTVTPVRFTCPADTELISAPTD